MSDIITSANQYTDLSKIKRVAPKNRNSASVYHDLMNLIKNDAAPGETLERLKWVAERRLKKTVENEKLNYKKRQEYLTARSQKELPYMNTVFGQHLGRIDAATYHRWKAMGLDWHNPKEVERFFQDNPEMRHRK